MAMGFGLGATSDIRSTTDARQWHDSYNTNSTPTSALSEVGKVTVYLPPAKTFGPADASGVNIDPRWLASAGLLVFGWLLWRFLK